MNRSAGEHLRALVIDRGVHLLSGRDGSAEADQDSLCRHHSKLGNFACKDASIPVRVHSS